MLAIPPTLPSPSPPQKAAGSGLGYLSLAWCSLDWQKKALAKDSAHTGRVCVIPKHRAELQGHVPVAGWETLEDRRWDRWQASSSFWSHPVLSRLPTPFDGVVSVRWTLPPQPLSEVSRQSCQATSLEGLIHEETQLNFVMLLE